MLESEQFYGRYNEIQTMLCWLLNPQCLYGYEKDHWNDPKLGEISKYDLDPLMVKVIQQKLEDEQKSIVQNIENMHMEPFAKFMAKKQHK
jgi:hypothetical protein